MGSEPIQECDEQRERRARDLYLRYGARPWSQLPEATREHFRDLVRSGVDGQGRPLAG